MYFVFVFQILLKCILPITAAGDAFHPPHWSSGNEYPRHWFFIIPVTKTGDEQKKGQQVFLETFFVKIEDFLLKIDVF